MIADKLYVFFYFVLSSVAIAISLYVCFTQDNQFWIFYAGLFFAEVVCSASLRLVG